MTKTSDTAGTARARMRLIAVLLLGLITAYLIIRAFVLMLLPETAPDAWFEVWVGVAYLVCGALYLAATFWVARRNRRGHIVSILIVGLGLILSFGPDGGWLMWVTAILQLAALVLLVFTVPRRLT